MHTKTIGDIAEAKMIAKALELGFIVSIPFGENQFYDLIIDDGQKLFKIQVKSRSINKSGSISVPLETSSNAISYIGKVDEMWVYCPSNDNIYVIKLDESLKNKKTIELRVNKSVNNQRTCVNYTENYQLKKGNSRGFNPHQRLYGKL